MALTNGQIRTLNGWRRKSDTTLNLAFLERGRFQSVFRDNDKQTDFQTELAAAVSRVLMNWFGWINPFEDDSTQAQTYWEPSNWAEPIQLQIETLGIYLVGCKADPEYMAKRLGEPVPVGCTRVAYPKLSFLQLFLSLTDVYSEIGRPIEYVCEVLEGKHGAKFKNWRKGELGLNKVRCNTQAAAKRKAFEATVPGDIIIADVDLANLTLGGEKKRCHTPRWSREEITHTDELLHISSVDLGWILILNPKRLTRFKDLAIDATLEEYFWGGNGWVDSLYFHWDGGQLHFGDGGAGYVYGIYAAGVAFLSGVPGNS